MSGGILPSAIRCNDPFVHQCPTVSRRAIWRIWENTLAAEGGDSNLGHEGITRLTRLSYERARFFLVHLSVGLLSSVGTCVHPRDVLAVGHVNPDRRDPRQCNGTAKKTPRPSQPLARASLLGAIVKAS